MKYDNLSYLWNAKTKRQRGERGVRPQPFGLMSKWSIGFILLSKTVGLYLPTIQWYSISLFSMHTLFTYIYIYEVFDSIWCRHNTIIAAAAANTLSATPWFAFHLNGFDEFWTVIDRKNWSTQLYLFEHLVW